PLESKPGFRVEYSCLGFVLLAEAIRRQSGLTLASYCERSIFKPLNMRSTLFNPPSKLRHRIAPTEEGNAFERSMAGDSGDQYPNWRVHRLHGEVHDGNAWFAGGEGGNAGLFSTAEDLTRFCRCMLNGGSFDKTRILSRETVEFATRNHTAALNLHRGLGWQMASTTRTAGSRLSLRAYGHTGFTGTSIWIDPEFDLAIVFLTNRIWYGGAGDAFGRFRGALHDTIMESITEKS
ncbi:MAG TPA: serine hydrolase, partial [bacterium]|nr:serine hydrolase [bacterium]